jgi:hypothetical protein
MSRFTERHLDPATRLGEILFGLIMVLTVTLTASFTVADGKKGVRQLLLAAIGSNVAWGIIDASMYIMNTMVVRRGKIRLVEAVQRASNLEAALVLVKDRVEPELQELLGPEKAEAFSKSVLTHIVGAHIKERILTKEDFYGALASFWLVFVSCLPAAIPFLIFSGDFFYSWSEFSASLPKADCIRAGLVVERTQASGNSDVRRGPLVGFNHKCKDKDVDLTIYWLAPGSREATFVFGVTVEF